MGRIVYGVCGEGFGHSSRAKEIIPHLEDLNHEVKVVSFGRGYDTLKEAFDVFEGQGPHITSLDNKVSILKTFTDNLKRLPEGHRKLRAIRLGVFKDFQPDCVITDFEPMTAYLANHYDLPLITIDNQHRIRYMSYPSPPYLKKDQLVTENVIRAIVPRPDVSLVTTFYPGEAKNDRTFLFPPILRREVMSFLPRRGEHVLVYLTSGFDSFLEKLKTFGREYFLVYGQKEDGVDGPIRYKAFSKEGFLEDLGSCKAVMATAGFTLITEALRLRKPYLAVPMRGQFEQELNSYLLARLNCGKNVRRVTREAIGDFLYQVPDFEDRLRERRPTDNDAIKAKLGELLADHCTLAREFHRKRTGRSP